MKPNVLIITNFSVAAQHALSYACQLLDINRYHFILAHIYRLPVMYTYEGVALASISETLRDIEGKLNGELERMRDVYPDISIKGQYVLGGLVEASRELIAAHSPEILIFGTAGYYQTQWHTDSELLLALRNLTVPVMIIPQHISFKPVDQIGFACDYRKICIPKQISFIKSFIEQTGAHLSVVHISRSKPGGEIRKRNEGLLHEALTSINPSYYTIESREVFKAIDAFVKEKQLDLLIVIPRKHEFWYSIFRKHNIDQLAFLNHVPILALPE